MKVEIKDILKILDKYTESAKSNHYDACMEENTLQEQIELSIMEEIECIKETIKKEFKI